MPGLYIHIPFCASRCIYCGFYSTTLLSLRDRYVNALCREMELRKERGLFTSIYLGGGTPSMLSPEQLSKIFKFINKVEGQGARDESRESRDEGCVSMGAQTFSDERLRFLHRRHSAADVPAAVSRLRAAGFNNISIDLMFGFPGETLADWQADIDHALALNVEHISAYSLMYEEGTKLFEQCKNGKISKINEETERQMYDMLIDRLTAVGYEHYEISNFAKRVEVRGARCEVRGKGQGVRGEELQSYRALHNSSYWHDEPYLGIGAAAHSYYYGERRASDRRIRCWNVSDIHQYIESIEKGIIPSEQEEIDDDTHYNDIVTTALRTREGISLSALEPKYRTYLLDNARQSLNSGLLAITDDHIHLTRQGLFVSDDVMSNLIYV